MRIVDLQKEYAGDQVRVKATVVWENCAQPVREIFIAAPERFVDDMVASPNGFLVGVLMPAMHFGERRIAIDGAVCPFLKQGLSTVMGLMQHWSAGRMQPLRLETGVQEEQTPRADHPRRAGVFLSGGIDSLATLRLNCLRYPPGHPHRTRDGLIVHGMDIGGVVARGAKYPVFDRALEQMAAVVDDAGLQLIPVFTNIRHLCDERTLWVKHFFGAVLAAVGHTFAPRLHRVDIASSYNIPNLVPCGSHPLLDPNYSSSDLRVHHSDVELARIEKLRIIADWPAALHHFRVCLANVPDRLNCGRCEKCVRTMTGLVAIDALNRSRAFAEDDVAPSLFDAFKITIRDREPFYLELIEPLRSRGRHDLVDIIKAKLAEKAD
jgi:hypothetical protein